MLVLTACVLAATAAFLFLIAGDGVYERAYAAFNLLAETQKPTDAPSPEPTIKPLDTPVATAMPIAATNRRTDAVARLDDIHARRGGNGLCTQSHPRKRAGERRSL